MDNLLYWYLSGCSPTYLTTRVCKPQRSSKSNRVAIRRSVDTCCCRWTIAGHGGPAALGCLVTYFTWTSRHTWTPDRATSRHGPPRHATRSLSISKCRHILNPSGKTATTESERRVGELGRASRVPPYAIRYDRLRYSRADASRCPRPINMPRPSHVTERHDQLRTRAHWKKGIIIGLRAFRWQNFYREPETRKNEYTLNDPAQFRPPISRSA